MLNEREREKFLSHPRRKVENGKFLSPSLLLSPQLSVFFVLFVPFTDSRLVLLLGTVLEDAGELDVVEHAALDRGLAVHLVHLLVGEPGI